MSITRLCNVYACVKILPPLYCFYLNSILFTVNFPYLLWLEGSLPASVNLYKYGTHISEELLPLLDNKLEK